VAIVVAASRVRHPLDARTLARLAARYAGDGPGDVVGFGLSSDERRGQTDEFAAAFAIAARAGLASVPHSGELLGPDHIRATLGALHPDRLGHGVRSAEDPAVLDHIVRSGIGLEVCPASNVALGVYPTPADVPLRKLVDAGARIALGADDPLLFGPRLLAQYEAARTVHHFTDGELASLARSSAEAWLRDRRAR
jgi:adenosine deaminase